MNAMASQIISLTIVCLTVYSGADQRKHQSSASLAFVWGIHLWPVNSPHKGPVTRKYFYSMTSSCWDVQQAVINRWTPLVANWNTLKVKYCNLGWISSPKVVGNLMEESHHKYATVISFPHYQINQTDTILCNTLRVDASWHHIPH